MLRLCLKVSETLPANGPSLAEIRTTAERLGRDLDNFAALSLMEITRLVHIERDGDLKKRLEAALKDKSGEQVTIQLDIPIADDVPPSLGEIQALATKLRVRRDRLTAVALSVFARYSQETLDSPENKAYWDAVEEEVRQLPEGYTTSL